MKKSTNRLPWILLILLLGVSVLSLATGTTTLGINEIFAALWNFWGSQNASHEGNNEIIIWAIRLPRLALGILVGAGLAAAGAVLQGIFRNPLADPGLIGVSAGGTIGAIVAILILPSLSLDHLTGSIPFFAFLGSFFTTFLAYKIAQVGGRLHVSSLLLTGIAINALASALIGAGMYLSNNEGLRQFTFWTLGSLAGARWEIIGWGIFWLGIPLALLPRFSRDLNALLLGEAEAQHLGINPHRTQGILILLTASITGFTVAFCGLIGFVGLVVPHLVRHWSGPDHRKLMPACMLTGAIIVVTADILARSIRPPLEIPLGIFTALLGAPYFLVLILRRKKQLSW